MRVLSWYSTHRRKLPWRSHPDPYVVWVSEIMLQQTRVETVIPYFKRWMVRFRSIADLAIASEQDVLMVWEGLGYYSRARNLHKAARIVMSDFGGELPCDPSVLRKLPGIGRYTAGAIASIAFGQDVASLDGNLRRVFARVFNVTEPADSHNGEKILWSLAEKHLPKDRAGDFNQGLMDLGATICFPHKPACQLCPLGELCLARALGIQEQRPVLKPKALVPRYTSTAAVFRREGKVLILKRPTKGLLGGMWEFPGGKVEDCETLEEALCREVFEKLNAVIRVEEPFSIFRQKYTHFCITVHAFLCKLNGKLRPLKNAEWAWVAYADFGNYPMGKVDRQIARRIAAEDFDW